MKNLNSKHVRKNERGYALLLVAFAATLLLIAATTAAPKIKTMRRRESEQEMIWRGNQYVRGIKLYYRKNGRFPTSLEDLTKPQMGNIRFMRQQYKDPMNPEDGSWRLIYVGPSGQLIGSLKPQPSITLPGGIPGASGVGTPAANLNGAGANGPVSFAGNGQGSAPAPVDASGQPSGGAGQGEGPRSGYSASGPGNGVSTDVDANGGPALNLPPDSPAIIGGNIIGIGSKASGRSVIVYDKATNYRLFEFYWDPSKDVRGFGQPQNIPGTQIPGAGAPGAPIGNPGGTVPQNPLQGNPPQNQ
jgi:type II secretory pathway pseudopilin PulG